MAETAIDLASDCVQCENINVFRVIRFRRIVGIVKLLCFVFSEWLSSLQVGIGNDDRTNIHEYAIVLDAGQFSTEETPWTRCGKNWNFRRDIGLIIDMVSIIELIGNYWCNNSKKLIK